MNIVRFKDEMKTGDDVFNTFFRGRYCYCVNWKYAMSLDVPVSKYVQYSKEDAEPQEQHLDISLYSEYVDTVSTDRANAVDTYKYANEFVPSDITLEKVKKYRTFVAESLLAAYSLWDEEYDPKKTKKIKEMLEYYKTSMYDAVVERLSEFTQKTVSVVKSTSSCSCATASVTLEDSVSVCDPLSIYRDRVWSFMCEIFGDQEFWKLVHGTVVPDLIRMTAGVIQSGLVLKTRGWSEPIEPFRCKCTSESEQQRNISILQDLITALEYIAAEETIDRKNFIANALKRWSTLLYENMQW